MTDSDDNYGKTNCIKCGDCCEPFIMEDEFVGLAISLASNKDEQKGIIALAVDDCLQRALRKLI